MREQQVDRAVDAANLATPGVDLSLWGLFVEADIVVKVVMIGLLAASVWVWAVVFEKWSSLRKVNREADGFEDRFWSGGNLEDLFEQEATNPTHPMAAVFGADFFCEGVRVAQVHKRRQRYTVAGCTAEMTDVVADGRPIRTVAMELEDPARVVAAVREMGLDRFENISYPRGLKRLLGLSA